MTPEVAVASAKARFLSDLANPMLEFVTLHGPSTLLHCPVGIPEEHCTTALDELVTNGHVSRYNRIPGPAGAVVFCALHSRPGVTAEGDLQEGRPGAVPAP